eukprot:Lankesteria_metandrocarpae@DN8075_c0_g1_i1.p1
MGRRLLPMGSSSDALSTPKKRLSRSCAYDGKDRGRIRYVNCLLMTLEDLYVILSILVGLVGLVMTILVGFNAFSTTLWCRIYSAVVLSVGCLSAFLQAVPSWRISSPSSHVMASVATVSLGSSVGLVLSAVWEKGLNHTIEELRNVSFDRDSILKDFRMPVVPLYTDSIIFLGFMGCATAILSALLEFALKLYVYPRRRPCKYILFLVVTGIASLWNTSLGLMTVNPDIDPTGSLFNKSLDFGNSHSQPLILMASLRFGATAALCALFQRSRVISVISEIVVLLLALCHTAFTVFSFVDFKVEGAWEDFPNYTVGVLFISTSLLLILSATLAFCCAPASPRGSRCCVRAPHHSITRSKRSRDVRSQHVLDVQCTTGSSADARFTGVRMDYSPPHSARIVPINGAALGLSGGAAHSAATTFDAAVWAAALGGAHPKTVTALQLPRQSRCSTNSTDNVPLGIVI